MPKIKDALSFLYFHLLFLKYIISSSHHPSSHNLMILNSDLCFNSCFYYFIMSMENNSKLQA